MCFGLKKLFHFRFCYRQTGDVCGFMTGTTADEFTNVFPYAGGKNKWSGQGCPYGKSCIGMSSESSTFTKTTTILIAPKCK